MDDAIFQTFKATGKHSLESFAEYLQNESRLNWRYKRLLEELKKPRDGAAEASPVDLSMEFSFEFGDLFSSREWQAINGLLMMVTLLRK